VTVMLKLHPIEFARRRAKFLTPQQTADHLAPRVGRRRQIGEGALLDALALAHAFTQQIGRPCLAIGYGVDMHGAIHHDLRQSD
jgi:hypothetical protein